MDLASLPVAWANYASIAGFLFLLFLVWRVPRHLVYSDAPDRARWRDLRWWATGLIIVQIGIYSVFA